jgi:hypothetical protein
MPDRITLITGNAGKAAEYAAMLGIEVTPARAELTEVQSLDVSTVAGRKAADAFAQLREPAGVPVMTGGSEQPAARREPAAAAAVGGWSSPLRPDPGSRPLGCVPAGCIVTAVRRCRASRFPRPRTACLPCGSPVRGG